MLIVTLATQKGGSGKSTLAASLSVMAQEAGHEVCVLEMDRQGTISEWRERRDADWPLVLLAEGRDLGAGIAAIGEGEHNMIVIDTPGAENPGIRPAILAADLVVIPVRPTVVDIEGCLATAELAIALKKEFVFVISQVTGKVSSRAVNDTRELLSKLGPVVPGVVALRNDYQHAMAEGLGVSEYAPKSKAASEMRALWQELAKHLKKGMKRNVAA